VVAFHDLKMSYRSRKAAVTWMLTTTALGGVDVVGDGDSGRVERSVGVDGDSGKVEPSVGVDGVVKSNLLSASMSSATATPTKSSALSASVTPTTTSSARRR
jgi:hypothetical protein